MVEFNSQTGCRQVAFTGEEGSPTSLDLIIQRNGGTFLISVTTAGYLAQLRERNSLLPSGVQLDDKFFIIKPPIPSVEDLCKVFSRMPFLDLEPYLIKQQS